MVIDAKAVVREKTVLESAKLRSEQLSNSATATKHRQSDSQTLDFDNRLPLVDAFRTFLLQPSMQVRVLFADIKGLAPFPSVSAKLG